MPPAIPLRYGNFVFFFVLLMQMAFSFRPRLLLWSGLCGAVAWTLGFLWVVTRPGVTTGSGLDLPSGLTTYLDPSFVSVLKYEGEIIAFLVVAAGLALLVRRSRILVAERAEAERERSNLARYFSPKVVEVLAERDEPLGRVRRQAVGVLFADLVGFTTLAEDMTPEEVIAITSSGVMSSASVVKPTRSANRTPTAWRRTRPSGSSRSARMSTTLGEK